MSTYAIGDIQGCHQSFLNLLERCAFDSTRDRLWLVDAGGRELAAFARTSAGR